MNKRKTRRGLAVGATGIVAAGLLLAIPPTAAQAATHTYEAAASTMRLRIINSSRQGP